MRGLRPFVSFALLVLAVACGRSSAPTSPSSLSSSTAPGARTGATIGGSIQSLGSFSPSAVRVAVSGTSLSAAVDGSGRFSLAGVPGGDVDLRFTGSGVDARLTIASVQMTETIMLGVKLGASTASVDTEARVGGSVSQAEGGVGALSVGASGGTFVVAGQNVRTDAGTRFTQNGASRSLGDLSDGRRVNVTGTTSGPTIMASTVEIEDDAEPPETEEASADGTLTAITGTPPKLTLTIDGKTVRTSSSTQVRMEDASSDLSALALGQRVEAEGTRATDGSIDAVKIQIEDQPQANVEITGLITSRTGVAPTLTLVVGTTTVQTSAATKVDGGEGEDGGSDAGGGFAALQVGATIEVKGTKEANGSVDAAEIEVKSPAGQGAQVDVEGTIGGLTPGCPAVKFVVSTLTIVTDASTSFEDTTCAGLANGVRVEVSGTKQADGSVKATRVEKKD